MPTYEYACRDCGHRFDAVQSIHDDALTECPECGGSVRRVVAAVGVQFKGSGFYRTDNRPSGKGASGSSSSGSTGEGGTASETKVDKKAGKSEKSDSGGAATTKGSESSGSAK